MRNKTIFKRVALIGLLVVLAIGISGCLAKPDVVDELPSPPVNIDPFEQVTPTPSPAPTPEGGWSTFGTGDPQGGDGTPGTGQAATPTPTPTIAIVTAAPTPIVNVTAAPPTPTATPLSYRNGDSGQGVRDLQQRLKTLGYYAGNVDGDFGDATEAALRDFQTHNDLTPDGVAGTRTLSILNSDAAKSKPASSITPRPTLNSAYATSRPRPNSYTPSSPGTGGYGYLQLGSSGAAVTRLQERLQELGYFKGTVNGQYGADTEAAVFAFQERNGEWADGIAGPDTQMALYSTGALAAPIGGSINVPQTGYRTLKTGETGDDVSMLQTRLAELGYYDGAIDGKYGPSTVVAVTLYQQVNGLEADGVAGTNTQARIYSEMSLYAPTDTASNTRVASAQTLEIGSMGDDVYRLQERLYDLGYYKGRIDGIYSDTVATAIRAFQTASKLTVDGKAGRKTQNALYADNAKAAAGADDIYATLRQGDTGERVRALQDLLATYGYYAGAINGTYDTATTLAVQQLQIRNDLYIDGIAGPATQQLLYSGSVRYAAPATQNTNESAPTATYATLNQGASGPDVTMLQQFLRDFGFYAGELTGSYDAKTLLAVQDFQDRNGLKADGIAGSDTLALLYSGNGLMSESLLGSSVPVTPERDTMRQTDEGQDVFTMQERLQTLGYLTAAPDGKFGSSTKAAVEAFQQRNNLKVDGIAGKDTVSAMYSADAVPSSQVAAATRVLAPVDTRQRELAEQEAGGAIQASIAGGGVAASHGSTLYYAGSGGKLYMKRGDSDRLGYDGKASYIHASTAGVTFVSGNKILRMPTAGGNVTTLATVGNLKKLSVIGESLLYQDGNSLVRLGSQGEPQVISTGIADFTIDIEQYLAYTASNAGIRSIGINGANEEIIVSTPAQQVQLGGGAIFFRSDGNLYRIEDGISVLMLEAKATWMGVYRDKVYYIEGGNLYRCDTDGKNNRLFYDGQTAGVSFVAGKVYITAANGGPVTEIISADFE